MASIAIIDDDPDQRETLQTALLHYLKDLDGALTVLSSPPFRQPKQYFDYLTNSDVCLLILDERLNNRGKGRSRPVRYRGNQLVSFLRRRLKDFPIFAVTTYATDEDLVDKSSEFELIINREQFISEGGKYVPILIRSAHRYLDSNSNELAEFDVITRQVARGNNDPKTLRRLKALQAKLELPFSGFDDRSEWLNVYDEQVSQMQKLLKRIRRGLKNR